MKRLRVIPVLQVLFVVALFSSKGGSQTFTRVDTGQVVTEVASSWGCAWSDFNNDGILDLFVGNNGVNSLFMGNGAATFTKVNSEPFLSDVGDSRGGSWGDYDNDGNIDLFVPNNGTDNFLYHNEGAAGGFSFTRVTDDTIANDGADSRGSSWADYDTDGFLDMFVARNGNNFLYRNNGDGSFTQADTGAIVGDGRFSIGPSWCDFDNDGYPDLFVANMSFQGNFLYHNEGGGWFIRDTSVAGTDVGNGAAGTWADYDNDGDMDLFVANAPGANYLYMNTGPPDYSFTKVTTGPIVADPGTSYGSTWADFDNDGDLDLFVANVGTNFYFRNDGPPDHGFTKITAINIASDGGNSYGSCVGDVDRDGDLDIFIANTAQNFLYLNDGNAHAWTNIVCVGTTSNVAAIGARVRTLASINGSPTWQMQDVVGQTTYYSQSSTNIEFGFGDATVIDSVLIEWPSGVIDRHGPVEINRFFTATEGGTLVTGIADSPHDVPLTATLFQNYPNPFNPETIISFSLQRESHVRLVISTILGEGMRVLLDEVKPAGFFHVPWDGSGTNPAASGVYFYRLTVTPRGGSGVQSFAGKMLLLR